MDLRYGDSNTAKEGLTLAEEKTQAITNRRKKNTTKIDGNGGNLVRELVINATATLA